MAKLVIKNIGAGTDSKAYKKGNVAIGEKPLAYGPTNITGYWNGIDPPTGGHTIYLMSNASTTVSPSIYTVTSNSELISLVSQIAGQNYTTITEVLNYINSNNTIYLDSDISQNAVAMFDSYNPNSYSGSGNIWYDISGNGNHADLVNSPSYVNNNIRFDGVNDYMITPTLTNLRSISMWFYYTNVGPNEAWKYLIDARNNMPNSWYVPSNNSQGGNWSSTVYINGVAGGIDNIPFNQWTHIYLEANAQYTSRINFMSRVSNNENAGGDVNAIEIYTTTKTSDEIALLFNSKRNRFGL
jgi:hypothetical protein